MTNKNERRAPAIARNGMVVSSIIWLAQPAYSGRRLLEFVPSPLRGEGQGEGDAC